MSSFSFFALEQKQKRTVYLLFGLLVCFYSLAVFLFLGSLCYLFSERATVWLPWKSVPAPVFAPSFPINQWVLPLSLTLAFLAAYFHWVKTTSGMVDRLLRSIDASPLDMEDGYHLVAQHVLSEAAVAAGVEKIEGWVISAAAKNACALADSKGRQAIVFTEGLISRLSREELQAIAAHEVAHCANGHAFLETVASSLFDVYSFMLRSLTSEVRSEGVEKSRERLPIAQVLPLYFAIGVLRFLSLLTYLCLSRQREIETDAAAVRLNRNPMALASALALVAHRPEVPTDKNLEFISTIFLISPRRRSLDEQSHCFATLFSTHPPLKKRLSLLLKMAQATREDLIRAMENHRPPLYPSEGMASPKQYYARDSLGMWHGPMRLREMVHLPFFQAETLVYFKSLSNPVQRAKDIPAIAAKLREKRFCCPLCQALLSAKTREGVVGLACPKGEGFLLDRSALVRILLRSPGTFPQETIEQAKAIEKRAGRFPYKQQLSPSRHQCPACQKPLRHHYYGYIWNVEVESCSHCLRKWFTSDNLQLLECLHDRFYSEQENSSWRYC